MLTIDKTQTDKIIDGLFGNNDLTASPSVWYGLHQIKTLSVTEIITCGECEKYDGMGFCGKHGIWVHNDDFCSYAERRTDDKR